MWTQRTESVLMRSRNLRPCALHVICLLHVNPSGCFALNTTISMQQTLLVFWSQIDHTWQTRELCERIKIHRLTIVVSGEPLISFWNSAASLTYVFHCFSLISFAVSTWVQRTNKVHNITHGITEKGDWPFNPLNAELNPTCYLLALLAHHFLYVSRIRVISLTLRLLMSYIYIYIYIYIWH